jgi:predicted AAA+ superfamily ATPase
METKDIRRLLYGAIRGHLDQPEISLIIGPRQAGKTTLMETLGENIRATGARTLFLSMDIEEHALFFSSQRALQDRITLEFGAQRGYVFLDEIQRKKDAGLFLKGLYDTHLPHKLIVSGSGSVELKQGVHESLLGRKRMFELSTVSFTEFAHHRTEYRYADRLVEYFDTDRDTAYRLLDEYLCFGGYPRVVTAQTLEEKRAVIRDIYQSYIEKDIAYLLRVERIDAFGQLIRVLASQSARLLNHTELSQTLGIALPTLKDYLWYAEHTFIIDRVTPFFRNARKEITKAPVVYFHDLGLANMARGIFGMPQDPITRDGFLFQNFVYGMLKEACVEHCLPIHYWRTKDRAEVDFIIEQGANILPIEVKDTKLTQPIIGRSLHNFIRRYAPPDAYVINLSLDATIQVETTTVHVMPFWKIPTLVSRR